jgi:ATP citrate (pro-S)-lyase
VYESTRDLLKYPQLKTIAIIAEGVPERRAREILWEALEKDVLVIGPGKVVLIKLRSVALSLVVSRLETLVE